MSELHKFVFDDLPVRGALVRLTHGWAELLQRRAQSGAYPAPVTSLLGELTAAAVLLQSGIKFDGTLSVQIAGDGPVRLAVAQVQTDGRFRATATLKGPVDAQASLQSMVNAGQGGLCAITLAPADGPPGQRPYQGVVALSGDEGQTLARLSDVIERYMSQSEQLQTRLVLAANDEVAAGLLIQRLPDQGQAGGDPDRALQQTHAQGFERVAMLASSLQAHELLAWDAQTVLHRLFWQEDLRVFEPLPGASAPRFACSCSKERVSQMLRGMGQAQVDAVCREQGRVEVGCDFCGLNYAFNAADVAQVFG